MVVEDLILDHAPKFPVVINQGCEARAVLATVHLRTLVPDDLVATANSRIFINICSRLFRIVNKYD